MVLHMLPVYPEINALQSGMRKKSASYIKDAEKMGFSEDVCTYVKCDIGMMLNGNIGPTGEKLPDPDLLLLSYTGCFTFMKWFENLEKLYPGVEIAMLHTPYQEDGRITEDQITYMVKQLEEGGHTPKLEKVAGKKLDRARLAKMLENSSKAEDLWVKVLHSAKTVPSPIDSTSPGSITWGPCSPRSVAPNVRWSTTRNCMTRSWSARQRACCRSPQGGDEGGAVPPVGGRPAELDQFPRVLEDLLRHGR